MGGNPLAKLKADGRKPSEGLRKMPRWALEMFQCKPLALVRRTEATTQKFHACNGLAVDAIEFGGSVPGWNR